MAIKIPSFKLFSATSAKSRIMLVALFLFALGVTGFLIIDYLGGFGSASNTSRVAATPNNLKSVPGGELLSPEYRRAVVEANAQKAKQAQMTGASAVPTILNIENQQTSFQKPQQGCTVMCPDRKIATVADDIRALIKANKLSKKDADQLLSLANKNSSIEEYSAALDSLVKAGKLTPAEARALLEKYKKEHQARLLQKSASTMDSLIRSGDLSLDDANRLLALEKSGVTPSVLSGELNRLVKEGRLSPEAAARLLAQYTSQEADEAAKKGIFNLQQLAKQGGITPDVAKELEDMQTKRVPVNQYLAKLDSLVAQGKLTPLAAKKLAEDYQSGRAQLGSADVLNTLAKDSAAAAASCVSSVAEKEKIPQELADDLIDSQNKNLNMDGYRAILQRLLDSGKLNQQSMDQLSACYQKYYLTKLAADKLQKLQANNSSMNAYADELKKAVRAGLISPEKASDLMREYQAMMTSASAISPSVDNSLPSTADFSRLRERIQEQSAGQVQSQPNQTAQFAAAASAADLQRSQERQQRVQQLQAAMASQAQSLLTNWQQGPKMAHFEGKAETSIGSKSRAGSVVGSNLGLNGAANSGTASQPEVPPLIKSGTIAFGVLETAVDSDYPDTPVMVSIVNGPLKGATLIGKLSLAQGQSKVSLQFIMMNRDDWMKSKTVSAYAIDPDTARTVMATSVDNHYLKRYGSLFAASFLSGYSSAIQSAGSSGTTGIFGTSTVNPNLSPGNRFAVALGQVGTAFTNVVQGYVNTPATVKIDAGVGLGILFISDVT